MLYDPKEFTNIRVVSYEPGTLSDGDVILAITKRTEAKSESNTIYSNNGTNNVTVPLGIEESPVYIIGSHRESYENAELIKAREERWDAHKNLSKAEQKMRTMEKEVKELEDKYTEANSRRCNEYEYRKEAEKKVTEQDISLKKYEQDINKIRAFFGEKAMMEALGEEK